jgi:hypothetical protein
MFLQRAAREAHERQLIEYVACSLSFRMYVCVHRAAGPAHPAPPLTGPPTPRRGPNRSSAVPNRVKTRLASKPLRRVVFAPPEPRSFAPPPHRARSRRRLPRYHAEAQEVLAERGRAAIAVAVQVRVARCLLVPPRHAARLPGG